MATETELEDKFWKALKSDMVAMLGLDLAQQLGRPQPSDAAIRPKQDYAGKTPDVRLI